MSESWVVGGGMASGRGGGLAREMKGWGIVLGRAFFYAFYVG